MSFSKKNLTCDCGEACTFKKKKKKTVGQRERVLLHCKRQPHIYISQLWIHSLHTPLNRWNACTSTIRCEINERVGFSFNIDCRVLNTQGIVDSLSRMHVLALAITLSESDPHTMFCVSIHICYSNIDKYKIRRLVWLFQNVNTTSLSQAILGLTLVAIF